MSSVAYIMQWGDHKTNVHNHLRLLFEEQKFVDLTLFCSTHSVKVHSVVIASNSTYFEKVLLSQNGVNSVIVLKDMKFEVLRALIEFMYCGETTVLDEDVDALLYASRKFEVKGLNKMTRQGVVFSAAAKAEGEGELNHRFIFPAESAQPGMIQAVIDLTKSNEETSILENHKLDSLYFKQTLYQKRGRPHKKHGNLRFPEAAMSDTEYAILKEAEESRKALEKLQKYVLNPDGTNRNGTIHSGTKATETSFSKSLIESKNLSGVPRNGAEDEIAAQNLTNELNKQKEHESSVFPVDVPIFVDDGNGNYITLDVEMANMIAGQEIKYNLVQGVVMTSDAKGAQHSNPASILIPETQHQPESMPILTCSQDEFLKFELNTQPESSQKTDPLILDPEEISSTTDNGITSTKRKPFVVKEIIKLKQVKKNGFGGQTDDEDRSLVSSLAKLDSPEVQGIMF